MATADDPGDGASLRVYRGILRALELRELVPGQRLVESDIAAQYGVGRNAVREAVQWLAARGVLDLSRHRSPAIRQLDPGETLEVLDVAQAMIALVARTAAARYTAGDAAPLDAALAALAAADEGGEGFSRARRHFYRALIAIGGNRELRRLFPAVGIHIVHAKYQSPRLQRLRLADYRAVASAVAAGDAAGAEAAARAHVDAVRAVIVEGAG